MRFCLHHLLPTLIVISLDLIQLVYNAMITMKCVLVYTGDLASLNLAHSDDVGALKQCSNSLLSINISAKKIRSVMVFYQQAQRGGKKHDL